MISTPEEKLKTVKRYKKIRNFVIVLAVVSSIIIVIYKYLIGFSPISGYSMFPTLENGDYVLYSRIDHSFQCGDVIALQLPSGEKYVKRIVAIGGDTVDIIDGVFYRNGEAIDDMLTLEEEGGIIYPLIVPEGDVFTLGDNRPESIDSRFFGTVNLRQVQGVLKLRFHGFTISKVD